MTSDVDALQLLEGEDGTVAAQVCGGLTRWSWVCTFYTFEVP